MLHAGGPSWTKATRAGECWRLACRMRRGVFQAPQSIPSAIAMPARARCGRASSWPGLPVSAAFRAVRAVRGIGSAGEFENAALVTLLMGLGMQGDDWSRMTPRHLYHIVSALRQSGMEAEARMIAAEAIART